MQKHSTDIPPIMRATAPIVALSCCLCIRERSSTIVHTRVKRRKAMNIGTFRSAVPAIDILSANLFGMVALGRQRVPYDAFPMNQLHYVTVADAIMLIAYLSTQKQHSGC